MNTENKNIYLFALIAFILIASTLLGINMMPEQHTYHDESFHIQQIKAYFAGKYQHLEHSLTMIPGYHSLVAFIAKIFIEQSIAGARLASFFISIPSLIFFYLISKKLNHESPILSTVVFYLSPIFFPFFFVIYTDIPSLAFILAGLYATLCRHYTLASVILLLSMLLRQTNIIWLVFCWALIFLDEDNDIRGLLRLKKESLKWLGNTAAKSCLFPLAVLAFLVFVYLNKGVALGDTGSHKIERLYITQVFFWLLTLSLLLLPLHIKNIPKIYVSVKNHPEWLLLSSTLFALYFFTFWVDHGYNDIVFFLRNKIIMWTEKSYFHRAAIFIPMILAFLSLAVTPLREKRFYLLYPVVVLSLLPHSLIDQRYFMESTAMLYLFIGAYQSKKLLLSTLALYIPISTYLYMGISKIEFFL